MFGVFIFVGVSLFVHQSSALNHVRMLMPSAVLRGDSATLRCHFDLEGDTLYSVKWYKGRQEFYRYTPRETPPVKTFPIPRLPQLQVEVPKSNSTQVTLKNVMPAVTGRYSCEVSADAPSFHTALVSGQMDVVTAPKNRPFLLGLQARYKAGDTLRANCTSSESWPAAKLSWLLNGHQVDKHHVKHHVDRESGDGLETSVSILEKLLTSQDFNSNGRLKIRCTASILDVYWQTTEKSAEWERSKDNMIDYSNKPSVLLNLKTDVEGVVISKENYEPTRVTASMSSASSNILVLPAVLWWRTLVFQYSFVLT